GFIARTGSGERVPCRAVFPGAWNGTVVVWASADGCAALGPGAADAAAVKRVVDSGAAVLAIDVFNSGSFQYHHAATATVSTKPNPNPPYAGYVNGYNRTIIAERAHDLLTAIALAKGWHGNRSIQLIAH